MLTPCPLLSPSPFRSHLRLRPGQIGEGSGWTRWDLANWRPAALSSLQAAAQADAGVSAEDQEKEEGLVDSAIEVRRDRVRMRVYRSVLGTA